MYDPRNVVEGGNRDMRLCVRIGILRFEDPESRIRDQGLHPSVGLGERGSTVVCGLSGEK